MNILQKIVIGGIALFYMGVSHAQKINFFDPATTEFKEGKFDEAIKIYEDYLAENEGFLEKHKAVYNYKIGFCHVAKGDLEKGWNYLLMSVDSGYDDVDIMFDVRYEPLHKDPRWEDIERKIEASFVVANFHIPNIKLAFQLYKMHAKDILYRNSFGVIQKNFGKKSAELDSVKSLQNQYDLDNQQQLREILVNEGWPGKNSVGKEATLYAFDILKHSKIDVQKEFLPEIKAAFANGSLTAFDYAVIEDQISLEETGKQIYGTQVIQNEDGSIIIEPIMEERNLDARRKKIGLETMADYMIVYGYDYQLPKY